MSTQLVLDAAKKNRRAFAWGLLSLGLLPLGGCMAKPLQPAQADGTYCHSLGRSFRGKLTCTIESVPPLETEADAKRFEPSPGALTLHVVPKRWGDARNSVATSLDGHRLVTTNPESLARIHLKPGEHRLALEWEGSATEWVATGAAGELRFVELVGSVRSGAAATAGRMAAWTHPGTGPSLPS